MVVVYRLIKGVPFHLILHSFHFPITPAQQLTRDRDEFVSNLPGVVAGFDTIKFKNGCERKRSSLYSPLYI